MRYGITLTTGFKQSAGSGASTLLGAETQGLAIDFTDATFLGAGHYGSAKIIDTGTPANDYDSHPYGKLTYTSPSAKMTLGPSGTLRFGAMNLYVNSASPANQSVTVVSGATYAVTITGSVSTTASGAATGTWTVGTQEFTAATGTLTFGSTSGSGTVHVRRTPSDSTYLETAGSARYSLPFEWSTAGVLQGILVEEARTNLVTYSDDLTNAAWTKSNMTTAKTATGADGVANSATTLTATAGNATALQAITSGSAARITSCYIKRRTGSGNIDLTQDNGSTWTTVTVTSSWTRVNLSSVTSTNPTVGIRIVTSGDAVDVQLFQHELGAFITSPIATIGSTVTRAADDISLATSAFPYSAQPGTLFAETQTSVETSGTARNIAALATDVSNRAGIGYRAASFDDFSAFNVNAGVLNLGIDGGDITVGTPQKIALAWATNDAAFYQGGTQVGTDGAVTFASVTTLHVGSDRNTTHANSYIRKLMYLPRRMANADVATLTT